MSRSFPMFVVTLLAAGVMSAEAHQLSQSVARPVSSGTAISSAFAKDAPAQSSELADKVKAALKSNSDLSGPSDAVTVTNAGTIVTLDGTVPTPQIRAKIADFVKTVDGVTKVVDKIKLPRK